MQLKHASLCILAYKRPDLLRRCIRSISETADYPYTLIVNLDGDDSGNAEYLFDLYKQKKLSYLILNAGNNRGVGRSFQNCLGVAEGEYVFKIDTDLLFKPYWLSTAIGILDRNREVATVSLFDYSHYDPRDTRFTSENNVLLEKDDCYLVKDFVSSIYGFRNGDLNTSGAIPDDGLHHAHDRFLAISKEDYIINDGFGVGKSVYVSGTEEAPYKTPTFNEPLIFHKGF